ELVHRQAAGSGITTAAHDILEGNTPETMTGTGGDFFTTYREDPEEAAAMVERVVCERIPEKYGLDPRQDILVLSPMYKGPLGVDALNERLGARLNPSQDSEDSVAANGLRVGDKVMVVRNDYDREVFNGDTGKVVRTRDGGVVVEMEGKLLEYEVEDLPNLIRSWCVTVHRSQGSEALAVVVVLGNSHWIMLRRNLLYTGITRGKKLVTVIASKQALRRAIGNAEENSRYGLLQNRL
ncbi:MAG: ATP-binding domain-containing protein, partial [Planctomycetota bacterium]|nr:ATP-binding domain-containing protein [Planctomycetota bacterium]